MEVVLLEDVKALGKKGQVVKVNDGYARNFILPKKLGVEAINGTIEVAGYRVGVIIGVKGIKTKEDLQAKIDAGEDVEGIVVTIANGKATTARYGKINASDLKLMK